MDELPIGPHRLRWTPRGSGEPVVLVHSSGMSSRQWRRLGDRLSTSHLVVVPDLLGYGASTPWPREEHAHFAIDQLALERLVDRLVREAGTVHLVGHSYGGFLALLVALHRPGAIRSVAVFEPVSFGVLRSSGEDEALATVLPGESAAPYPDTDAELEAWLEGFVDYWNGPGGWRSLGDAFRDDFRKVARKVVGEVRTLGEERTPHHAYEVLDVPVLLLGGESSTLAAKRVLRVLERAIPGAVREEIAGAGHMGPLTHAGEVNERIVAHIAGATRPAK
jgi:pimeloyl-ACP methyl ester carboxylesterase